MTDKKHPAGEYEVGYCKPPEATRFKKGRCGNDYGRKGKPENRAAIAKKKQAMTMQETLEKVGRKRRTVRTADGSVKTMQNHEMLLEAAIQGALKSPALALKLITMYIKDEQARRREPEQQTGGGLVIQQPAATMEQSLARVKARQEELREAGSLYGVQPPSDPPGRGPSYPPRAAADPRETRAYGPGDPPQPRQELDSEAAPRTNAVPLAGPNTKVTRYYR